ncbi:RNA polymerase sigma factor FecI [Pseudomonas marincola]|uniref:RNA polymerase, sigma 19 factor KpLE2 phage-like element n=1 Tax=Pseudomonas marincola TaxID=437900 RepID=A0A653E025_9PSED|nr:sigma-70 family RNA polymerase sigma factor [Pseudomonas marincola]CAE6944993.1 RNA polymerase sigma factor FecI [Pseudomonas marincola]
MTTPRPPHHHLVGTLYLDHRDWLFGWLRKSLKCPQFAEDISQDTFVRLLAKPDLELPKEPRALLTTIAKGLVIDQHRRKRLEQAYLCELAQLPLPLQPGPEEQQMALEALLRIDQLLGKLSAKARAAFLYSQVDGLKHQQIAELLGVSVSRVRQYLAQGLRQCYVARYGMPE